MAEVTLENPETSELVKLARRAAQGARADATPQDVDPPFAIGEVVRLKSGGFMMTVVDTHARECCDQCCVDVVFASAFSGELVLEEKHLPASCLRLVDPKLVTSRQRMEDDDNIPF